VLISSSGNSPNLVAAAAAAIARGARVIALVGFTGGALKQQAGECLWVPSETGAYELVEDAHAVLCHILTRCLIQDRPPTVSASRSDRVPPT
jgi:D-sedoheptulose 7-phosphate isomerase